MADDWKTIVREHGPRVFGIAWRILGNAADAEDVVQEVFLEFHRMRQERRTVDHCGALLRHMATRRAIDRLRQRKHTQSLERVSLAGASDEPEEAAIGHELEIRLRQAIARLPQREAEVFCLRHFEDLPYERIADSLRISPGAVGAALSKARSRLETLLATTHKRT